MNVESLLSNADDLVKSQPTRLFDIYALGPLLIYAGLTGKKGLGKWTRRAVFTSGVFVMIYNYARYKNVKSELESRLQNASL